MVARRLLALISVACFGCSYPDFDFTRDTGAVVVDAAVAEVDSESVDTSAPPDTRIEDTAVFDTGTAMDTSDASDTAPPRGCSAASSLFCDDFDAVTTPAARWDSGGSLASGSLSLSTTGPYSPPNVLVAELAAGTTTEAFAKVGKSFDAPSSGALTRMDAWLYFENATYPGGKAIIVKTQMTGGHGVALLATSSGFGIEVYGASAYDVYPLPSGAIPIGKWFHLRIDATLKVSGGMYRVFIDDMTTPVDERTSISTTNVDAVTREYTVGLYTNEPTTGTYRVRFDDVRFEFL